MNTSRRRFVAAGLAGATLAAVTAWWRSRSIPYQPAIDTEAGRRLLEKYPAIDVHSHPGRSFLVNGEFDSLIIGAMEQGFEAARVSDMQVGNVTASLFSIVADVQVLGITLAGAIEAVREFRPGEAYADFRRQIEHFQSLADAGVLDLAQSADDIRLAHRENRSVVILSCEGADFVEDQPERLSSAYDAGVRSITLIHYRPGEYGDSQTSEPVHGGLTAIGGDVVREMNRLGMVIDMAHAAFETVRDVVELSTAPIMISHSHLANDNGAMNPRLISPEHADLVARNHGVIGAWPAGITSRSMSDFVDETFRLIDQVGVDHVAIGTDLDANYKPVLTDYSQFPEFVTLLLDRGLSETEASKVVGQNFLRVFDAAAAAGQELSARGRAATGASAP